MKPDKMNAEQHQKSMWNWTLSLGNMLFTLTVIALYAVVANVDSVSALWQNSLQSAESATLTYAGYLENSNGEPVIEANDVSFAIYDSPTGGTPVWGPEMHYGVPFATGNFVLDIGSVTAGEIPTALLNGDRYVEVSVSGETLAPRTHIAAASVSDNGRGWYTNNVVGPHETQSISFATIPGLSLTIETSGNPVYITFDGGFSIRTSNATERYVDFAIFVDGVEKNRHAQRVFDMGQSTNSQIHWAGELESGEHLIEVKWRVNAADASARTAANQYEKSFLIVQEINQ